MVKLERIQSIQKKDEYELKPHIHGQWKVIRTRYEYIDITCKDSPVIPDVIEQGDRKIVYIGSLQGCEDFIKRMS